MGFVKYVKDLGERICDRGDLDYWVAEYAAAGFSDRTLTRSGFERCLYGLEHFLPEVKPLTLGRESLRGWQALQPSVPHAPIPEVVMWALAALGTIVFGPAVGLAIGAS